MFQIPQVRGISSGDIAPFLLHGLIILYTFRAQRTSLGDEIVRNVSHPRCMPPSHQKESRAKLSQPTACAIVSPLNINNAKHRVGTPQKTVRRPPSPIPLASLASSAICVIQVQLFTGPSSNGHPQNPGRLSNPKCS